MERTEDFCQEERMLRRCEWKGFGDNYFHKDEILSEGTHFQHFIEVVKCNNSPNDLWGYAFVSYQDAYITVLTEVGIENNKVWGLFEYCIEHTPEELIEAKESLEFFDDCIDSFELLAKEYGYDTQKQVKFYEKCCYDDPEFRDVIIKCKTKISAQETFGTVYKKFHHDHKILGATMCGAPFMIDDEVVIRFNKHFKYGSKTEW